MRRSVDKLGVSLEPATQDLEVEVVDNEESLAVWFLLNAYRLKQVYKSHFKHQQAMPMGYDLDDLIQETYLRCRGSIKKRDKNKKLFTWVTTIFFNVAREQYRKSRTEKRNEGNVVSLDVPMPDEDVKGNANNAPDPSENVLEALLRQEQSQKLADAIQIIKAKNSKYGCVLECELTRYKDYPKMPQREYLEEVLGGKVNDEPCTLTNYKTLLLRAKDEILKYLH
jgi:RNA polymerase sigma factor (sigma-70 family)